MPRPLLEVTMLSRMSVLPRYFEKPAGSARTMLSFCEARRLARPVASSPLARCCCPNTPITTGPSRPRRLFESPSPIPAYRPIALVSADVVVPPRRDVRVLAPLSIRDFCAEPPITLTKFESTPGSCRAIAPLSAATPPGLETRDVSAARSEGIPAWSAFSATVLSSPRLEAMRVMRFELRT